jgi:hypothetical protein
LQQADANQGVLQAKVNVVNLSMPEIVEPVKNLNADDLEKHKATIGPTVSRLSRLFKRCSLIFPSSQLHKKTTS